jgi:hypothetical protein
MDQPINVIEGAKASPKKESEPKEESKCNSKWDMLGQSLRQSHAVFDNTK